MSRHMLQKAFYRQSGIATVEFAIVLPVLVMLLLGVTELGRAMLRYNALTKAVQEGARYAAAYALLGSTGAVNVDPQLLTEVRNVVVFGNTAGAGGPVLDGLQTAQVDVVDLGGDQVRVDVSYPYEPLLGPVLPNLGPGSSIATSFVMQASVTMRAL
jgi:Flp pilus assembly protein TadG